MGGFGQAGLGRGGIKAADRPSHNTGKAIGADLTKKRPKVKLREIWPEIWALVKPRRWLMAGCFCIMVVNRACSLVLPLSFKPLIDQVFTLGRMSLLPYVVGAVMLATLIQGVTSYALTQLLSKSGQRMIAELRKQVQQHVAACPLPFTMRTALALSWPES